MNETEILDSASLSSGGNWAVSPPNSHIRLKQNPSNAFVISAYIGNEPVVVVAGGLRCFEIEANKTRCQTSASSMTVDVLYPFVRGSESCVAVSPCSDGAASCAYASFMHTGHELHSAPTTTRSCTHTTPCTCTTRYDAQSSSQGSARFEPKSEGISSSVG